MMARATPGPTDGFGKLRKDRQLKASLPDSPIPEHAANQTRGNLRRPNETAQLPDQRRAPPSVKAHQRFSEVLAEHPGSLDIPWGKGIAAG